MPCHCGKSSQNAPESISEYLKFKNFPGGMPPDPPSRCPFARTAPGLLSPILDPPLSRTTRKLHPLPLLRDRVKDPNHCFLSATDSLAQDIIGPPFHDIWIRHCVLLFSLLKYEDRNSLLRQLTTLWRTQYLRPNYQFSGQFRGIPTVYT